MKKYFIVSDVHSYYWSLIEALDGAGFDINNPDHIFVSLGDLLDRGSESVDCLIYVLSIPAERRILISGNHDDLLYNCLVKKTIDEYDISNGTEQTIYDLSDDFYDYYNGSKELDQFDAVLHSPLYTLYHNSLVDYYETNSAVFVHGWIPCLTTYNSWKRKNLYTEVPFDWRTCSKLEWQQAKWINGMEAWANGITDTYQHKTIFCGHYHTSWGHCCLHNDGLEFPDIHRPYMECHFSPFVDDGIIAMDACTAYTGKVNCFVLEEEEDD